MKAKPLYDYGSQNSVENLLFKLPRSLRRRLAAQVHRASRKAGLTYIDDSGRSGIIPLTLRPRLISKPIHRAMRRVISELNAAFNKIAFIYRSNEACRRLFTFNEREKGWMEEILPDLEARKTCTVLRWDANTAFGHEDWSESFCFFEVNGVGIGGLWYASSGAELLMRYVIPELERLDPGFRVSQPLDMKRVLFDHLSVHRRRLGRTRHAVALMMDKAEGTNYVEFERLAKVYTGWGARTILCGPADVRLRRGELSVRGQKVDVIYRDTELSEFTRFEEQGHDLSAVRHAFRRGQIISTFEGEFDHKSAFEVFTDPRFHSSFTRRELGLIARHILWTRLLRETVTTAKDGKRVDLVPYTVRHQAHLILKPNRAFGGKGVTFGEDLSKRAWQAKIEQALAGDEPTVVQEAGLVRQKRFPDPRKLDGRDVPLYVVSGFYATSRGLGVVGRVARNRVVNVAAGGGLSPILLQG